MKNFGTAIKNFFQNTMLGSVLYTLMCISIFFIAKLEIIGILVVSFYTLIGVLNCIYLAVKNSKN